MVYVIGSGPAGVSCALALVKKGLDVTMLDSGLELEPERREILQKLHRSTPEDWDEASLNVIKQNMSSTFAGIPLKYVYGSDFPYREADKYIPLTTNNVQISPSLAQGGFSNVWGAAVLPYLSIDIDSWPISATDLAPHYESVFSFMNLAAAKDDLASMLPLYTNNYQALRPSNQAVALLEDLKLNKNALNDEGIVFGYSRLAVQSYATHDSPGCIYCGLCMYGCPYGLIYTTSSTLSKLQFNKSFRYMKDVIVQKLVESGGKVRILAKSRLSNETIEFEASRVYLACGVLSTTKILLESLEAYDHPLTMKDSQYFLLPFVRYRKVSNVVNEELHTLSQVFVDIFDPSLSKNTIHLQLYTYNDLYLHAIRNILGPLYSLFKLPVNELLGRLLLIQGYLHSNVSSTISIRLQAARDESSGKLIVEANPNKLTQQVIKGVLAKLMRNRRYFQAMPIPQLLQIARAGRGFHSGGTFPMKRNPSTFESDCLGRPYGFKNVHIVDATTFPSIPTTTIALSVMANAHRIASAYEET